MPSLEKIALDWLQPAINMGLSEYDFWNMTIAEIKRFTDGATWRIKSKAQMDYQLANLIGISVARIVSNEQEFPAIETVYPHLFDEEMAQARKEISEQEKITTDSTNRFLEFAMKHNARLAAAKKEVE